MRAFGTLALVAAVALAACGGSDGETLYREPHDDGNTFACATCHALAEPAPDGLVRPGHPIGDAAARTSWKNGRADTLLEAVNSCRVEWMNASAWSANDPAWEALRGFLEAEAPAEAPALSFAIVEPPEDLAGGDADAGRDLFNTSCTVCHGDDATGTERAPPLDGELLDPETIARRVRTSGQESSPTYDGLTGGRMPFWAADRLSDDGLRDLVAFVDNNDLEDGGGDDGGSGDGELRECDATHDKVGQVAELETRFHGVSGTATIVDDCTVEITDFSFDGQGIVVEVYGAEGSDYGAGFSMSDDLRRPDGYDGDTIVAQLPDDRTLDELGGLSIWCVSVGQSFGDGTFSAP